MSLYQVSDLGLTEVAGEDEYTGNAISALLDLGRGFTYQEGVEALNRIGLDDSVLQNLYDRGFIELDQGGDTITYYNTGRHI